MYCYSHPPCRISPFWANRNLGANRSDVLSGGIFKREVNVAVCFHFCLNDAASESIGLEPAQAIEVPTDF